MSEVLDRSLAPSGERKMAWAWRYMPLLQSIAADFDRDRPLAGLTVAVSLHIEAKTANLCRLLQRGGAEVHVTGCNPLSTQDDVAAALAEGMDVHAIHGCSKADYDRFVLAVLDSKPDLIIDDGGDLVGALHLQRQDLIPKLIGGCEETTTGIVRLLAMEREKALRFPMIDVNDAQCKHFFDNRYGTGQSVWDGVNRATNLIVAGKTIVVAGYGWCGRGIAMRAKGLGARVIVTEIDPVKAIEAVMDGFDVMTMDEAAPLGDVFITATGCRDVITPKHFGEMRDGALLANGGHFNVEIDVEWLEKNASATIPGRTDVTKGYVLANGKTLFVLADGRLVNLASGDGHPVEIMDMSFAIQALSTAHLTKHRDLSPAVHAVPQEIDTEVAKRWLNAAGKNIDILTDAQKQYLNSWGTV